MSCHLQPAKTNVQLMIINMDFIETMNDLERNSQVKTENFIIDHRHNNMDNKEN